MCVCVCVFHYKKCTIYKCIHDIIDIAFNIVICKTVQAVLADFEDYLNHQSNKEVMLVADAIRLSASVLSKHPDMLGPQVNTRFCNIQIDVYITLYSKLW